jgi:SPP1 gp7 family putative phage head morphogenesis protein
MPSDLDRAIAQARRALLARESTATTALLDAWGLVWDVLARELAALTAEIAAARAAGEDIGLGWLYRSARYHSLMAQLADEVIRYSVSAEQRIAAAQRVAATAGWADAGSFIGAQGATLAGSFDVLPADALRELVGVMGDGSPLSSLLAGLGPQAAEATRAALVTGVALGQGPPEIAKAVRTATNMVLIRAVTIARQESLRAYRGASFRRWQADDLVVGWWWSSAQDRRTCAICWAKHGTEHSIDEPFASHVCCRCVPVPLLAGDSPDVTPGTEAFAALDEDMQREILGPGKFDLYAGDVTLDDLVAETYSARWGPGLRERSLAELAARGRRWRRIDRIVGGDGAAEIVQPLLSRHGVDLPVNRPCCGEHSRERGRSAPAPGPPPPGRSPSPLLTDRRRAWPSGAASARPTRAR